MPEKPNIVFIFSDQHRGDAMGCAGNPAVIRDSTGALIYDPDGAAGVGYAVLINSGADTVAAADVLAQ